MIVFHLKDFWMFLPVFVLLSLIRLEGIFRLIFYTPHRKFISAHDAAALFDDSEPIWLKAFLLDVLALAELFCDNV